MGQRIYKTIVEKLAKDEPRVDGKTLAAVSIILRGKESTEVLLIKRAERAGDPWSGQVAFPGGKVEKGEKSAREVAIRETMEEVGIDLAKAAVFLGYFEPHVTHTGTMNVVPSVYLMKRDVEAKPNAEVFSWKWVSLQKLIGPKSRSSHTIEYQGQKVEMPAYLVGGYEVWGLTHRILAALLSPKVAKSE